MMEMFFLQSTTNPMRRLLFSPSPFNEAAILTIDGVGEIPLHVRYDKRRLEAIQWIAIPTY